MSDPNKKESGSGGTIGAIFVLLLVFGLPLFYVCVLLSESDSIGFGPVFILIIFFVICGANGWKDSGASNAAPPPPPKPPAYVDKHWQHSPGGIETQKFEGGYNGELNKEFEQK